MEFLRFGSSIPGSYWGCCACCIIQNFNMDPDAKTSIQLVSGDGGGAIVKNGKSVFAGKTYKEVFENRIRIGTFDNRDMPNHAFLAILTANQVDGSNGKKWLKILKEHGFEFIRTVSNSVYGGQSLVDKLPTVGGGNQNYLFGLFRNIGSGAIANPFIPPKAWSDLEGGSREAVGALSPESSRELAEAQFASQMDIWKAYPDKVFYTETELEEAGVPVILAGERSKFPQQPKAQREATKAAALAASGKPANKSDPFAAGPALTIDVMSEEFEDDDYVGEDNDDWDEDSGCGVEGCEICC